MTVPEMYRLLDSIDLRQVREDCGISQASINRVLGATHSGVWNWEHRICYPGTWRQLRGYTRIMLALARHLEIRETA